MILRSSGAPRWVPCPGSAVAESSYPNDETESSREGTASHWVFGEVSKGRFPRVGDVADNGVVLTDEMVDGALEFMDIVSSYMTGEGQWQIHVEEHMHITRVSPFNEGHPDIWIYNPYQLKLIIFDYKFGRKFVAPNSWQLINYAVGAVDIVLGGVYNGRVDEYLQVKLVVYQPRCPSVRVKREFDITASDLRNYANKMNHSASLAFTDNPPTVAGPHCSNCLALGACETFRMFEGEITEHVFDLNISELSDTDLEVEYELLEEYCELLKKKFDAIKTQMITRLNSGKRFSKYTIGFGRGSVFWKPEKKSEIIEGMLLIGADPRKDTELMTPIQFKAKYKAIDTSIVDYFTDSKKGSVRLVKDEEVNSSLLFKNNPVK
jgi:hypothetical protein